MGAYDQVRLPLESVLGSLFGSVLESVWGAYLRAYRQVRLPLESLLGRKFGSVLERVLGAYLGV